MMNNTLPLTESGFPYIRVSDDEILAALFDVDVLIVAPRYTYHLRFDVVLDRFVMVYDLAEITCFEADLRLIRLL